MHIVDAVVFAVARSFLLLSAAGLSSALRIFAPNDTSISTFPDACAAALSTNVSACRNAVATVDYGTFYPESVLEQTCTAECMTALISWFNAVDSACGAGTGATYTNDRGFEVPVSEIPGTILLHLTLTCLTIDGYYCNVLAAELASTTANGTVACTQCGLQTLYTAASSRYLDGMLIRGKGVYSDYTAACAQMGAPVLPEAGTASTLPAVSKPSAQSCTDGGGTLYTVQAGDSCTSVSQAQNIATNWLLLDNELSASCADFPSFAPSSPPPVAPQLCLLHTCATYTVTEGDSCAGIAEAHNITRAQLQSYNPWLDAGCYNLHATSRDKQICVERPGGQKYKEPASEPSGAVGGNVTATTAAAVPGNVAANTTTNCGLYYEVEDGDDCGTVTHKFAVSLADFMVLNEGVKDDCTNLAINRSYCVQPVGDINTYPDAPGLIGQAVDDPSQPTPTYASLLVQVPPFLSLPKSNYTPQFDVSAPPLAPGTWDNCTLYASADKLLSSPFGDAGDGTGGNSVGNSSCEAVAGWYGVNVTALVMWNPSLVIGSNGTANGTVNANGTANANGTDTGGNRGGWTSCVFGGGFRYCVWDGEDEDGDDDDGWNPNVDS